MRTLQSIQADLEFVLKKKSNFLVRLFSAESGRLADLRREEFICLDKQLLETHAEYARLAASNLQCLQGLSSEFKVTALTYGRKGATFGLSGETNIHGFTYCNRKPDYNFSLRSILVFNGSIDHFGTVSLQAVESEVSILYPPKTYTAAVSANGVLALRRSSEEFSLSNDVHIDSMAGDLFHGNERKRKEFLRTRQQLYRIIGQHRFHLK